MVGHRESLLCGRGRAEVRADLGTWKVFKRACALHSGEVAASSRDGDQLDGPGGLTSLAGWINQTDQNGRGAPLSYLTGAPSQRYIGKEHGIIDERTVSHACTRWVAAGVPLDRGRCKGCTIDIYSSTSDPKVPTGSPPTPDGCAVNVIRRGAGIPIGAVVRVRPRGDVGASFRYQASASRAVSALRDVSSGTSGITAA
ncbi:hypothetical protein JCM9534A_17040 [Catenuloplanes indicus JCM 9534]